MMIRAVDANSKNDFLSYCSDKPLGIKAAALLNSYGTDYSFADFWISYENGAVSAAISRFNGNLTLLCDEVNDELCDFIISLGDECVTSDYETMRRILSKTDTFTELKSGYTLELSKKSEVLPCDDFVLNYEPSVSEFCKLLSESEGKSITIGDYNNFYADVSHRVRHGTSKCVTGVLNGESVSTAAASAISGCGITIGAVSVREDKRRLGIGYKTVSGLIDMLFKTGIANNKKICLLRVNGENEEFYQKLGFQSTGKWMSAKMRRG